MPTAPFRYPRHRAARGVQHVDNLAMAERTVAALTLLATCDRSSDVLADAVVSLTGADWAAFKRYDGHRLTTVSTSGPGAVRTDAPVSVDRVIRDVLDGTPHVVNHPDDLTPGGHAHLASLAWGTVVLVPVRSERDVAGVIVAGRDANDRQWAQTVIELVTRRLVPVVAAALHRDQLIETLERASDVDALTGLPNRRAWNARLPVEMARAGRTGAPLTVLAVQMDGLSEDSLREDPITRMTFAAFGESVFKVLRGVDFMARTEPGAFSIALVGAGHDEAAALAPRLEALTPAGWSTRIAGATWNGRSSQGDLMGRVEHAMYLARTPARQPVVLPA